MPETVVGVILAGGRSTRMGRDKALASLDGRPLVAWVASALADAGLDAVLAGPPRQGVDIPAIPDAPGGGPVAGLVGAFQAHPGASLFVVGVDQPLLRAGTVRAIAALAGDVVAPLHAGIPQVTCALYRPRAEAVARRVLTTGRASLRAVATACAPTLVEEAVWRQWGEDGRSWESIDTPRELRALQRRM